MTDPLFNDVQIRQLHAHIRVLRAALDAALRIHGSVSVPAGLICREDGAPHPCPTVAALGYGL